MEAVLTLRTPIGRRLKGSRFRLVAAGSIAGVVLFLDLLSALLKPFSGSERLAPALLASLIYLILARGDLATSGLRATPAQGWRYWMKATVVLGAAVLLFVLSAAGICALLRLRFPIYRTSPSQVASAFLYMCILAPLVEEATYRLVLSTAGAALLGPWQAVLLSGVAFAALHILYGNPAPDNMIAGFILGWAYLHSGTIVVPIALHALGNLCALAAQVAAWYFL